VNAEPELFPSQAASWVAWPKRNAPGQRWQAVAEGETEEQASQRLLDVASRSRSGSFSSVVLPAGERP
jgi:hypothetical protein